jgi:hypothetical protein
MQYPALQGWARKMYGPLARTLDGSFAILTVGLVPADGRLSLRESTLGSAHFRGAKGDHFGRNRRHDKQ